VTLCYILFGAVDQLKLVRSFEGCLNACISPQFHSVLIELLETHTQSLTRLTNTTTVTALCSSTDAKPCGCCSCSPCWTLRGQLQTGWNQPSTNFCTDILGVPKKVSPYRILLIFQELWRSTT